VGKETSNTYILELAMYVSGIILFTKQWTALHTRECHYNMQHS